MNITAAIVDFLKQPLIGSLIGILGIVIGAFLAILFYIKSKVVAQPKYSIESVNLIDLNKGAIPNDVSMIYDGKQIKRLTKTIIRIWNAGKKTIDISDLVPPYIEIPFCETNPELINFLRIDIEANNSHTTVSAPTIVDKSRIQFYFNFLDQKDQIKVEILHTAEMSPSKIVGYIKGVPKGFINVSDKQEKMAQAFIKIMLGDGSIINDLISYMIQKMI